MPTEDVSPFAITVPSRIRLESARMYKIGLFTLGLYIGGILAFSSEIDAAVLVARAWLAHELRSFSATPNPPREARRVAHGPKRQRRSRIAVLPTYDVNELPLPTFDVGELPHASAPPVRR